MRFLIAAFCLLCAGFGFSDDRPNVIVIMADDFGRELIGALGGESYSTPNLDQMATDGMQFDICYATPMCSPTRNLILSGKYNFRNYTTWGEYDFKNQPTLANCVSTVGYATGVAGKWHLGGWKKEPYGPEQAGFARFSTFNYPKQLDEDLLGKGNFFWNTELEENSGKNRLGETYSPRAFLNFTTEFIKSHAKSETPFFYYYPLILAHRPFTPTDANGETGVEHRGRVGAAENFPAMVEFVDDIVGSVRKTLAETGQEKNTLLIFTADNGTDIHGEAKAIRHQWKGRDVRGGKYFPTEMGANVPFFAVWPGKINAGSRYSKPIDFSDVMPTVCGLAGAEVPANSDGHDLTPVLLGTGEIERRYAYTWGVFERSSKKYKDPRTYADELLHILRDERWKYFSDGRLFDIKNDPFEETPVEGHDEIRARFAKALAELRSTEPKLW